MRLTLWGAKHSQYKPLIILKKEEKIKIHKISTEFLKCTLSVNKHLWKILFSLYSVDYPSVH